MRRLQGSLIACLSAISVSAGAQIRVNPTGVSVSAMGATTVFLTFGGLNGRRPAEAFWCGALIAAAPDLGTRCDSRTLYGSLPLRYDLSRLAAGAFTDVMSIPPSVTRRAYQDAARGAVSTFFYVRRFESPGGGPDEYVAVTCRLTGGGAHVPFSLTDVRVAFDHHDELLFVSPDETPPPLSAGITYTGTGRLVGRWEVVLPGEEPPDREDLLTEGSLPPESRGSQRRFMQLERFNVFLAPGEKAMLPGPDPSRLPTAAEGTYLVLLRVEASDDREADSDLGAAGAGIGIVHSGAVAGFPLPVLRYVVTADGIESPAGRSLRLIAPRDGASTTGDSAFTLRWSAAPGAEFYRLELTTDLGKRLLNAIVPRDTLSYEAPAIVATWAVGRPIRWRVTALNAGNARVKRSSWRTITIERKPPSSGGA